MRQFRGKSIAAVFQDPMTSLNPVLSIGEQISETLRGQLEATVSLNSSTFPHVLSVIAKTS